MPRRHVPVSLRALLALLLLCLAPLAGCGGGSTSTSGDGLVTGRVLSPRGVPVAGATVLVVEGGGTALARKAAVARTGFSIATTRDDGTFAVPAPQGTHQVLVQIGSTVIARAPFTLTDFRTVSLGTLAVIDTVDSDGDGLSDAVEVIGWDVLLNLSARRALTTRAVTSDPALPDTDADGLGDAEELASLTDPERQDSDGDGLDDRDEIRRYSSNPTDVDTDQDAQGPDGGQLANPGLYDGNEVNLKRTSPTLADTDGDGLTDFEELMGGGLNPRRADVATIVLEPVGDPEIALNLESTTTQERSVEEFTLRRDLDTRTNAATAELTLYGEYEQKLIAEGQVGVKVAGFSGKAVSESTWKLGFSATGTYAFTHESQAETQASYRDNVANNSEVRVVDGSVRVAFRVRNVSNRGVIVSDLSVLALRVAPGAVGSRAIVGLLTPSDAFPEMVLLAPGGEFSFVAENLHLNAQTLRGVLDNPGTMFFEVANYTLSQADDVGRVRRDYAALGERILERCATVVVDFGGGRTVRGLVAASVDRNEDGSSQGVLLTDALANVLGLSWTLEELQVAVTDTATGTVTFVNTGQRVLASLRQPGFPAAASNAAGRVLPFAGSTAWRMEVASASVEPVRVPGIDEDLPPHFDEIRIAPGDQVTLLFLRDSDGDGVSDESELFVGSEPTVRDSDRDGLLDDEELFTGWSVAFVGDADGDYTYVTRSDPLQRDTDGDGRTDLEERDEGTDPNRVDTDLDGVPDDEDDAPLELLTGASTYGGPALVHYPLNRGADASTGRVRTYLDSSRFEPSDRLAAFPALLTGLRPTTLAGIYDGRDRFGALNRAARLVGRAYYDPSSATRGFESPYLLAPAPEFTSGDGSYSLCLWFRPSAASFHSAAGAALRILGHTSSGQGPRVLLVEGRYQAEVPTSRPLDNRLRNLRYSDQTLSGSDFPGLTGWETLREAYSLSVSAGLDQVTDRWTHIAVTITPGTVQFAVPTTVRVQAGPISETVEVEPFDSVEALLAPRSVAEASYAADNSPLSVLVVPGTVIRVYQDGREVRTAYRIGTVVRPQPGLVRLGEAIGFDSLDSGLYDLGSLDDVRYFNRLLGAAEVQSLAAEAPR